MKQHKQWLWPLMLLMMGLVLVVAGCGTSKVAVLSVAYRDMPIQISADANVSALNKATITTTVSGQVSSYMVKTGDQVTQGQIVAVMDMSAQQQQLEQLNQQLMEAATTVSAQTTTTVAASVDSAQLAQAQQMRDAGIITQKEYNVIASRAQASTVTTGGTTSGASSAQIGAIQAAIAQVQTQINSAQITAPIAGTVATIYNEDRKMAIADRPFMLIQQASPVVASLSIPQDAALKLAAPEAKSSMKVSLKVGDQIIPGELTYVDTTQPAGTPSVLVKASFNNEQGFIKPGEFYTLLIESNVNASMLSIPKSVVHENQDGKYVYVVTKDNTVDVRVIETGETVDEYTAILSGLNEGEQVITTSGVFELGEKVEVTQ
ncbi:efflux RND transporter periplasmic adaptor subunit [Veillonella sp. YH-vei2232]|uniref:Efflux RND transporter periplasmic adaptor subunit n=1 Tax=Veillonella absiana TaxID=3079305 RepID=A0ABU3Z6V2_9FIRM|nr:MULTISPECIES: efflux RND transporter periplasmic adaptor subunit [unclassified Veillonella]MDV5063007.1 efflux RND transporter periplasmic adaptor subunit [Veillonella sp. YH-vei2232]MDV5087627.1 efflux RND transporter periplasmic adaptor subunit [Veillonella sp. YH-vei2233]